MATLRGTVVERGRVLPGSDRIAEWALAQDVIFELAPGVTRDDRRRWLRSKVGYG